MKKFTYVGTWRMSYAGMQEATKNESLNVTEFITKAISHIEDFPLFKSVGRGGLPNWDGYVETDAGYMNGKTMEIGALMGVREIANPFQAAVMLAKNKYNRMLSGNGALKWALANHLKTHKLETDRAIRKWKDKHKKLRENLNLKPYDGHDTVCFVGTDCKQDVIAGTSTSGLFMKKPGRVGDSPLAGSGFYADNEYGAAAATGLGEDISRGILSFRVIENIKNGLDPKAAAQKALYDFAKKMKSRKQTIGQISIIAINTKGEWGVATNCLFQFSIFTHKMKAPALYISQPNDQGDQVNIVRASASYWKEYIQNLKSNE